jgi:hypothetical protein
MCNWTSTGRNPSPLVGLGITREERVQMLCRQNQTISQYTELLDFWTFSIVQYFGSRNTTFRKMDLFLSSGEFGGENTYSVWSLRKS